MKVNPSKKRLIGPWLIVCMAFATIAIARAEALPGQADRAPASGIRLTTAWSADRVRPGDRVVLAVIVDMDPGIHLNADSRQLKPMPDFKPFPTELTIVSATAGAIGELPRYPKAHPLKVDFSEQALMVFDGRLVIYLPLQIGKQFEAGMLSLEFELSYQACGKDYCLLPGRLTRVVTRPAAPPGAELSAINPEIFAAYRQTQGPYSNQSVTFDLFGLRFAIDTDQWGGWLLVLLTAALGGLLLNVTPCVLPMIPIKIISLAHAAGNRGRCALLGLATLTGVVTFWSVLGLLIAFVSDFTAANQLFQYPVFTIALGIIITVMGLGMFANVGVRLPQAIYRFHPEHETLTGSFGVGILTAVLSTPCTAPFMGAAAAFAVTQSPGATLTAFMAIGIGMGLPYFLLALFPALVKRIPRSGPASELVKQLMGLLMLAAAAYFIGVGLTVLLAEPPQPSGKWYWWPVMAICAAAGAFLTVRVQKIAARKRTRWIATVVGVAVIGLSVWGGFQLDDKGPIDWIGYTGERLQEALSDNKAAVLVFTAEWCLNCKALESRVFRRPQIVDLLSDPRVAPIKVDITGNNPAGKAKLRELGHLTIPLVVVVAPDGRTVFKSDFYTADQLVQAVEKAIGSPN